jgi:hypothetical protein
VQDLSPVAPRSGGNERGSYRRRKRGAAQVERRAIPA